MPPAHHAGTLFTIFEPDIRAHDLRATGPLVVPLIKRELRAEDLAGDALGPIDADQVRIAKTADPGVLGCMHDMAYLCEHIIATNRRLRHTDNGALNLSSRRNINNAGGYRRPIEHVRDRVNPEPG